MITAANAGAGTRSATGGAAQALAADLELALAADHELAADLNAALELVLSAETRRGPRRPATREVVQIGEVVHGEPAIGAPRPPRSPQPRWPHAGAGQLVARMA